MREEKTCFRRLTGRLYGGLSMGWPTVLLLAVGSAVLTAVFLIVPAFRNTSFERMGVTAEAWVFFAVLIMANCKKPLESAVKTFVFFLVSQPLIYLLQVPFSALGWGLFGYYRRWFILTLLTFPAAWIGWYIKKKNWLSLLILAPVLYLLITMGADALRHTAQHFPRLLVTALFCLGQAVLYVLVFTETRLQKAVGLLLSLSAAVILLLAVPQLQLDTTLFLPDDPVFTENAEIPAEDADFAAVSVARTGQDSMVRVQADRYGEGFFTVRDGERVYRYRLVIYEDDAGHSQVSITPAETPQN